MMPTRPSVRRLIVLGSTGSIGVNVLRVVQHLQDSDFARFEIIGLAAGSNADLLAKQARQFRVRCASIVNDCSNGALDGVARVYRGDDSPLQLIENTAQPGDLVVGAMVGSAGVPATLAAIERGCDIALANKETLVAAGALVMPLVATRGVALLPVDSEHSAVAQCLRAGKSIAEVKRLVLTASGGPFRDWPAERLRSASVEEALNHPTWSMGRKITVDSASMMNKALEVIEAHWLFGLAVDRIEVVVHPQSIVHSFVEFVDGSVLAQLGPPDMRTPIQCALTWPERFDGCGPTMKWDDLRSLEFEQLDHDRFPAVRLAFEVIRLGGTAGAIFNAANEAAVEAFLDHVVPFGSITELVREALHAIPVRDVRSLDDVREADREARGFVRERIGGRIGGRSAAPAAGVAPRR